MKNNIKKIFLLVLMLNLFGCSAEYVPHPLVGKVIWQEPAERSTLNETRIKSVKLLRDTCNKITLEVSYFNDESIPGRLKIATNVGIPGQSWPMHPDMKNGHRTLEVQNGFQRKAKPAKSNELTVSIDHILDNKWKGYIDKVTIVFDKIWNNDCVDY